ncbi:DUF4129 domain-containing protein [Pseudomonas sp. LRF_L74]|uniref:DUF4129 domain-containing protein n=1 Tax=Pseudomonas sp. LRF_L74 TaxID=3369422 RepID=UPI003F5FA6E2
MRLTDASVAIRPRSAWEALDLGVLLAQRHAWLLMSSWAVLTLPVFAVLAALLWRYPTAVFFIFWWLKPAWERLPLYILSQALFGDAPTLREAFKALPRLLKPQLFASLTWRRFSPTRSFDLPVLQLEGLSGETRSRRLSVLNHGNSAGSTWLTLIGVGLEVVFFFGLVGLMYMMLPQQLETDWEWQSLLSSDADWLWLEHLSNLLYAFALVFWEPIYVSCGFTLYLNRRTALEAWDIELVFRRLRQRLSGSAYAVLLALGVCLFSPVDHVLANDSEKATSCPVPFVDPIGPEAERLQHQSLSSKASQDDIRQILDEPPFENREIVTLWRFSDPDKKEEKKQDTASDKELSKALEALFESLERFKVLAQVFEVLLWGLLVSLIVLLAWRYREWLRTFASGVGLPKRRVRPMPSQLFGLEVAPESLPDDVASEAERLWAEQPREALGLLYRALLSRLLHDFHLPLKGSHTEGEVLGLIQRLEKEELSRFSNTLTRHWQNLAYGHRLPPDTLRRGLCEGWRRLFPAGAPA